MKKARVLFLGKKNDRHCESARLFCLKVFDEVTCCLGEWGDPLPEAAQYWQGEYIVSYLSRWVVPKHLLEKAAIAAINFHPASPDYPGIGCNNFALYDRATQYGVTCHHMDSKVDTGAIIAVRRFAIFPNDDVESLLSRTYDILLALFFDVASCMALGKPLPESKERWTRSPYTRKEFNLLGKIYPGMSDEEIARHIRAYNYRTFRPTINLHGYLFEYKGQAPKS